MDQVRLTTNIRGLLPLCPPLLAVLVLLAAACGSDRNDDEPTPSPTRTPTVGEDTPAETARPGTVPIDDPEVTLPSELPPFEGRYSLEGSIEDGSPFSEVGVDYRSANSFETTVVTSPAETSVGDKHTFEAETTSDGSLANCRYTYFDSQTGALNEETEPACGPESPIAAAFYHPVIEFTLVSPSASNLDFEEALAEAGWTIEDYDEVMGYLTLSFFGLLEGSLGVTDAERRQADDGGQASPDAHPSRRYVAVYHVETGILLAQWTYVDDRVIESWRLAAGGPLTD